MLWRRQRNLIASDGFSDGIGFAWQLKTAWNIPEVQQGLHKCPMFRQQGLHGWNVRSAWQWLLKRGVSGDCVKRRSRTSGVKCERCLLRMRASVLAAVLSLRRHSLSDALHICCELGNTFIDTVTVVRQQPSARLHVLHGGLSAVTSKWHAQPRSVCSIWRSWSGSLGSLGGAG